MHRRSIHVYGRSHFNNSQMLVCYLSGFSIRFQKLSRAHGQVTYVLLTRSPLTFRKQASCLSVRLACIRHAASVHPEPGSNSPFDLALRCLWHLLSFYNCLFRNWRLCFFSCISCSVFKDHYRTSAVLIYITKSFLLSQPLFLLFFVFFLTIFMYAVSLSRKKRDSFSSVKPTRVLFFWICFWHSIMIRAIICLVIQQSFNPSANS